MKPSYWDTLKETTIGMLTAWRKLDSLWFFRFKKACGTFIQGFWFLILPFLVFLSPLLALLLLRERRLQQEHMKKAEAEFFKTYWDGRLNHKVTEQERNFNAWK